MRLRAIEHEVLAAIPANLLAHVDRVRLIAGRILDELAPDTPRAEAISSDLVNQLMHLARRRPFAGRRRY